MMNLGIDLSARVPGGPAFSSSRTVAAQGLDRMVVEVTHGTKLTVDLQPADTDKLVFLAASCTLPGDDPGAKVSAVLRDGSGGSAKKTGDLPLAQPLVLSGAALSLLPGAPRQIVLDYVGTAGKKAVVEVFVARII